MRVGSLFAGIGGFDEGFRRAGMTTVWMVEIDPWCRRVLARHFPEAQLYEDVRTVGRDELEPVDLICGGFPCQDLSVAGRRAGLAGERSRLFFEFARILDELRPRWVVIENVPGLLSSNGGRDMGTVLGALAELGYGYAYRVLDAQYFGVAQRRRRVFIVGCLGDWRSATEVLFEPESCERDTPPRRTAGRVAAALPASGAGTSRTGNERTEVSFLVAQTLLGKANSSHDHTREMFGAVRRLTPRECERLQGFPDDWTLIDGDRTPDAPRYRALGNAVAVPVAEWIGRRIMRVALGGAQRAGSAKKRAGSAS